MNKKVIEIRNLSYSYPDGKNALNDINFDIFEGETVGFLGPNGAGKTTMLLHLNGIIDINNGIKILDMEMNKVNLRNIRSKVGLVFQNPDDQLFSPTVFDDIAFGPINFNVRDANKCVKDALKQVGMENYENASSHHLSSGEKKKISIATVLALPCEILVLDEPTGNLDPRARRNLINLLKDMKQTKIIAGHDIDMVLEICDRVILMDQGKIINQATPKQMFPNKSSLEKSTLEAPLLV